MIRTDHEYEIAVGRLKEQRQRFDEQKQAFVESGLSPQELSRALDPLRTFMMGLEEEVQDYERLMRGEFDAVSNLHSIGRLLVRLRIARRLSQKDLADRLQVDPSQVSRDERNEYHGVTLDRAARIMQSLGFELQGEVRETAGAS